MFVSRNVVSVSEISAVNLIVGWYLFARSMNRIISVSKLGLGMLQLSLIGS